MMKLKERVAGVHLKTKLILIYFLTIFIPLVAVSQVMLTFFTGKVISQTVQINQTAAKQTSGNIHDLLRQYLEIVNRICFDNRLAAYLDPAAEYPSPLEVWDVYNKYLRPTIFYESTIMRNDLKIYYHNPRLNQDYKTFIYADDKVLSSKVYKNAVNAAGQPVWCIEEGKLYLARTLKGHNDEMIAVVTVEIPETRIYSLIRESSLKEKTVIICDSSGFVISSNDRSMPGSSIRGRDYFCGSPAQYGKMPEYTDSGSKRVIYRQLPEDRSMPEWNIITLIPVGNILDEGRVMRNYSLVVCAVCLLVSCTVFVFFLGRIVGRIKVLVNGMREVEEGRLVKLEVKAPKDEIGLMTYRFNKMVDSLRQLIYENYEAQLQIKDIALKKREAELLALQSRINPHFLFNTLESVRMKLQNSSTGEASSMLLSLSQILRKSLYWKGEMVTLEEEVDFVRAYLMIQKLRFKDRIDYAVHIPDELHALMLPKLILQPLVENSIVHGLEKKRGGGRLAISARMEDSHAVVAISDDGIGMDGERLGKILLALQQDNEPAGTESIGLRNVNDRLVLHYGSASALVIRSSAGKGTDIEFRIPLTSNGTGVEGVRYVQDNDRR